MSQPLHYPTSSPVCSSIAGLICLCFMRLLFCLSREAGCISGSAVKTAMCTLCVRTTHSSSCMCEVARSVTWGAWGVSPSASESPTAVVFGGDVARAVLPKVSVRCFTLCVQSTTEVVFWGGDVVKSVARSQYALYGWQCSHHTSVCMCIWAGNFTLTEFWAKFRFLVAE